MKNFTKESYVNRVESSFKRLIHQLRDFQERYPDTFDQYVTTSKVQNRIKTISLHTKH